MFDNILQCVKLVHAEMALAAGGAIGVAGGSYGMHNRRFQTRASGWIFFLGGTVQY